MSADPLRELAEEAAVAVEGILDGGTVGAIAIVVEVLRPGEVAPTSEVVSYSRENKFAKEGLLNEALRGLLV